MLGNQGCELNGGPDNQNQDWHQLIGHKSRSGNQKPDGRNKQQTIIEGQIMRNTPKALKKGSFGTL